MNSTDLNFLKKWQKARKKGFLVYSLLIGAIWGAGVALINLFLDIFGTEALDFSTPKIYIQIGFWILGGILLFGPGMWFWNESQYKKLIKKMSAEEAGKYLDN